MIGILIGIILVIVGFIAGISLWEINWLIGLTVMALFIFFGFKVAMECN